MSGHDYTGETIDGRYTVGRLLGKGGMGVVYEGRHVMVGKTVAIKILHAELAGKEDVVKRFYREAQAAAAIGHKNIIDVMDVGLTATGEPYLIMEYLEGESLSSMLKRIGPIDLAAACGVMEPALLALQAVHDKGIVHRDLKPDNIFLVHRGHGEVEVKLIDFGISKFTGATGQSQLTQTGSALGTPSYMSPEQARGSADVDARADIYSMGVILYEMLTGGLPFTGENHNDLLIKVLTSEPRKPREVHPGFPAEAGLTIMRAMAKNPAVRHPSATDLLDEIKGLSGFAKRRKRLTRLASGITERSFAGGDLGDEVSDVMGSEVASDVFAEMARKGTPGAWAGTSGRQGRNRKVLVFGLAGLAVVAIVVAVLAASGDRDTEPAVVPIAAPDLARPAPEPKPPSTAVSITVTDAPEGATIYYNGAPVPMNPFKVDRKETIAPLKVEAAGYETFAISIVPSRDRVIAVKMKPVVEKTRERTGKRISREAATKPRTPAKKTTGGKFRKGKSGTKFGNAFE